MKASSVMTRYITERQQGDRAFASSNPAAIAVESLSRFCDGLSSTHYAKLERTMKSLLLHTLLVSSLSFAVHGHDLPPRRTIGFMPSAFAAPFSRAIGVYRLGPYQGSESEPKCRNGTNGGPDTSPDAMTCLYKWESVSLYVSSRGKGQQADLVEVHSLGADETDTVRRSGADFMIAFRALTAIVEGQLVDRESLTEIFKTLLNEGVYVSPQATYRLWRQNSGAYRLLVHSRLIKP